MKGKNSDSIYFCTATVFHFVSLPRSQLNTDVILIETSFIYISVALNSLFIF